MFSFFLFFNQNCDHTVTEFVDILYNDGVNWIAVLLNSAVALKDVPGKNSISTCSVDQW